MTDWSFFEDHEPEEGVTGVREAVVWAAWKLADDLERLKDQGGLYDYSITFQDPDTPGPELLVTTRPKPKLDRIVITIAKPGDRLSVEEEVIEVDVHRTRPEEP